MQAVEMMISYVN